MTGPTAAAPRSKQLTSVAVAAALALALIATSAARASRVVAVGDIHGAFDPLVTILKTTRLIDDQLAWAGADSTLVQLGDFTDRGPSVRAVMDLLMRLQQEAPRAGGRVLVLLGNHEALNLVGELRDVNNAALIEFAGEGGEDREAEYREVVKAGRARARLTGAPRPVYDDAAHNVWMRAHPPGTLAYLRALEPSGRYGKWLRTLPTVTVIDDVMFLHAGLDVEFADLPIDQINARVSQEVAWLDDCRSALRQQEYLTTSSTTTDLLRAGFALLDQLRGARDASRLADGQATLLGTLEHCVDYEKWNLFAPEGPLWFRGYADYHPSKPGSSGFGWTDEEGATRIAQVLAGQHVRHAVVAHSPRESATIGVRFAGRVFLIDTGMLAEIYGGRPSALEIEHGTFTAIYPDSREEVWSDERETALESEEKKPTPAEPPPRAAKTAWSWRGPSGAALPFRGPEELEDFLRTAEVKKTDVIGSSLNRPLKVLLERDGVQANAVFRTVSVEERNKEGPEGKFYRNFRDSFTFECAAYELAEALGIDRVPPAVPRSIGGKEGSLQAWVENAMTESKRIEQGKEPPDPLRWARNTIELSVFDALINNQDRNTGNQLIDQDWNVWWIDHTRTFQTEFGEQHIQDLRRITPQMWTGLREVERARVRTVLKPFLRQNELDALFERWDKIVLHFRTLIAQYGVENVVVDF